jgi:putative membrane protein
MPGKNSTNSSKTTKSTPTGAQRTMYKTTGITSYVFRAPEPKKTVFFIFFFALIFGFIINFNIFDFFGNFSVSNLNRNLIIYGLVILGLPALLSGAISAPLAYLAGGIFYFRRSFLLAFFSMMVIFIVLFLGRLLGSLFSFNFAIIYIFGYALIFSIRHQVLLSTSNHQHLNSLPASINQTFFGFYFLWLMSEYELIGLEVSFNGLWLMVWFLVVFIITTLLLIGLITTPFRRNFGVNGLLLMKHALTQFTKDSKSGQVLEDEFFAKIGRKSNLRVGVVCFKPKVPKQNLSKTEGENKTDSKSKKYKAIMVVPSIHPGPFGILGGSNLPQKLFNQLKDLTQNLLVFHGTATHDQNPVSTKECKKIARSIRKLTQGTKFSTDMSEFTRITNDDLGSSGKAGSQPGLSKLTVCSQHLGNGTIYVHTSSPQPTDDIDYPTGDMIVKSAEAETKAKALFIDAHNCLKPGTGVVYHDSEKAKNMLRLVSKINSTMVNKFSPGASLQLEFGVASNPDFTVAEGFGPMGIQVMVLRGGDNQNKTYAYILLDGNNVITGLREKILEGIKPLVTDAEVFTTDNHIVNATMGGYNPIGLKAETNKIIQKTKSLVSRAIEDLEPCEVGMNSGFARNIRILGKNTPIRLSATVNSTISIMKKSTAACQVLALSICWIIAVL